MPDDSQLLELSQLPKHHFDPLARDVGDRRRGPWLGLAVADQVMLRQVSRLAAADRSSGGGSRDLGCFGEAV